VARKNPVTGYLMHTSDSAGSISATINVSHQGHLLRLRDGSKRVFGQPIEEDSAFEMCESNSRSPGRARISRKPSCECRTVFGMPVVTCLRTFLVARKAAGAVSIRHSLHPLIFEDAISCNASGAIASREGLVATESGA
jgi:hypothetical protein